jgi:hypothetical protein
MQSASNYWRARTNAPLFVRRVRAQHLALLGRSFILHALELGLDHAELYAERFARPHWRHWLPICKRNEPDMSVELCSSQPLPVSARASRLASESSCRSRALAIRPSCGTCRTTCTLLLECGGLRTCVREQAREPNGAVPRLVELVEALSRPVQHVLQAFSANRGAGWQDRPEACQARPEPRQPQYPDPSRRPRLQPRARIRPRAALLDKQIRTAGERWRAQGLHCRDGVVIAFRDGDACLVLDVGLIRSEEPAR